MAAWVQQIPHKMLSKSLFKKMFQGKHCNPSTKFIYGKYKHTAQVTIILPGRAAA